MKCEVPDSKQQELYSEISIHTGKVPCIQNQVLHPLKEKSITQIRTKTYFFVVVFLPQLWILNVAINDVLLISKTFNYLQFEV